VWVVPGNRIPAFLADCGQVFGHWELVSMPVEREKRRRHTWRVEELGEEVGGYLLRGENLVQILFLHGLGVFESSQPADAEEASRPDAVFWVSGDFSSWQSR